MSRHAPTFFARNRHRTVCIPHFFHLPLFLLVLSLLPLMLIILTSLLLLLLLLFHGYLSIFFSGKQRTRIRRSRPGAAQRQTNPRSRCELADAPFEGWACLMR